NVTGVQTCALPISKNGGGHEPETAGCARLSGEGGATVIGTTGALLAAAALALLLIAWIRVDKALRAWPFGSEDWPPGLEEGTELEACPPEFVAQIFSSGDLAYVGRLNSRELQRQFRHERNGVALVWVQQTSAAVQRIMRRHEIGRASCRERARRWAVRGACR